MTLFEATMDRREFLRLTGLGAGALVLASCMGSAGNTGGGGLDEWVWAAAEDPTPVSNPLQPGGAVGSLRVYNMVFDSLVLAQGQNLDFTGFAAESWEQISDTQIRMHIRKGMTFHNGDPLTADDVKYSLETGVKDTKLTLSYYIGSLKEVQVVDQYTADLILKAPYAPFLYNMSLGSASILPKKAREAGIDAFNKTPIGSGPFKVVGEWASGKPIHLEVNSKWWGGDQSPKKITVQLVQSASTRTAQLLAGQAQIIEAVNIADIPVINSSGKAVIKALKASEGHGRNIQYTFNTARPFFADLRVRQALNYAVDRQQIVSKVLENHGVAMAGIMPKGWGGYVADIQPWAYDPNKAKSLLQAAGFGSGFSFTWEITDGVFLRDREIAEAVAAQLKEVGVTANLRITERAVQFDHYYSGNWDLNTLQWPSMKDPDGNMQWCLVQSAPLAKYAPYEPLRQLAAQAAAISDVNQRTTIYQQLNRQMWDMCPWLYVHVQDEIYGVDKRIDWQPVPTSGQGTEVWYLDGNKLQSSLQAKGAKFAPAV